MEILVVNDDGIEGEGLRILVEALKKYGNLTVSAPDQGRSAASHSIHVRKALRFDAVDYMDEVEAYKCSGLPADCVRLATDVLGKKFDLIFSGINDGLNLGTDILYSGTVAGAVEGMIEGIPSVAISCDWGDFPLVKQEIGDVLEYIFKNHLFSKEYALNVNFPVHGFEKTTGYRFTRQGIKDFKTEFTKQEDGSYIEKGNSITYDPDPNTDVSLAFLGYVTFVPLGKDTTKHEAISGLVGYNKEA